MVMGNAELEGSLGLTAYRVLFERAPEGMIFSTLDGQIHAANPAACPVRRARPKVTRNRWILPSGGRAS